MREIRDRYAGSMLGMAWSVLQPLLLMLVLITIFGHVFGAKRPGATATSFDFIGYMIAGYVPWLMTSAALQSAASVIRLNPGLVRQITFPVAVLPAKAVFAQAPMLLVGLAVYFVYALVEGTGLSPLLLLLPVVASRRMSCCARPRLGSGGARHLFPRPRSDPGQFADGERVPAADLPAAGCDPGGAGADHRLQPVHAR